MNSERKKRFCCMNACRGEKFDLVHKFPMDNERAILWKTLINLPQLADLSIDQIRKRFFICRRHFLLDDYKNVESRSLNKTAVPSLLLNELSSTSINTEQIDQSEQILCSEQIDLVSEQQHDEAETSLNNRLNLKRTASSFSLEDEEEFPVETISLLDEPQSLNEDLTLDSDSEIESQTSQYISPIQLQLPPSNVMINNKKYRIVSVNNLPAQPFAPNQPSIDRESLIEILSNQNLNLLQNKYCFNPTTSTIVQSPEYAEPQLPQLQQQFVISSSSDVTNLHNNNVQLLIDSKPDEEYGIPEHSESSKIVLPVITLSTSTMLPKKAKRKISNLITMAEEFLAITVEGKSLKLSNIWLRDHCRCAVCYSHETFQRKINILDIPLDIKAVKSSIVEDNLNVTWSDGHVSDYSLLVIFKNQYESARNDLRDIVLWDKEKIESETGYARVSFVDLLADDAVAKSVVASLIKYGCAFVEKVPATVLGTEFAVKRLFPIQRTLFGEMWSFNDNKDHSDSAYSKEYLAAHTDNTYFNDAAGLQILHCLQHTGTGGENLLLDGFKAIRDFKAAHPESYERLCKTNVEAEYIEEGSHHKYSAPVIKLCPTTNEPQQIRFNFYDRSFMKTIPQAEMLQFYKDYRNLAGHIQSTNNEWWFKLSPGTVCFFDNWRLLHGRGSYTGRRQMAGCYVARTEFLSVARKMRLIS